MRLLCTLCQQEFKSLLIDHQKALREVSTKLATHIATSTEANHKQFYQEAGRANAEILPGVAWLLIMKGAEIPEDEEFILAEQERISDLIAEWLAPDDDDDVEEGPTPEGLEALITEIGTNDINGWGQEEMNRVIEYVFGPQDSPEPELEDSQKPVSKPL